MGNIAHNLSAETPNYPIIEVLKERTIPERTIQRLGNLAISKEILGINDRLAHLYQYLEKGDESLKGIELDFITDVAERLKLSPFVNKVSFRFEDSDFISIKDKVSMLEMTNTNLEIIKQGTKKGAIPLDEYARAKLESEEVLNLTAWFKNAIPGTYMVIESLPIGQQLQVEKPMAIPRIYKKIDENTLEGVFLSLFEPNVHRFNNLRQTLGTGLTDNKTEYDLLKNSYEFYNPELTDTDKFIEHYVNIYDSQKSNEYSFGLKKEELNSTQNGIERAKNQPHLIAIYKDIIKSLGGSEGVVTNEIMQILADLKINHPYSKTQIITPNIARNIISEVALSVVSTIDKAKEYYSSPEDSYAAASIYGNEARSNNEEYSSNGCPEFGQAETDNASSNNEEYAMKLAFGIDEPLKNFGEAKMGVCRIPSCPSRGESKWWPKKTIVGGCDVCICCHKIFSEGKSPEKVHKDTKKKQAKKLAKLANAR